MHASNSFGFRQCIHVDIKLIHQLGDALQLASCLVRSGLTAIVLFFSGHRSSREMPLRLGIEGEGLGGRLMPTALKLHGQFCARCTEVTQGKSKGNDSSKMR